MIHKIASLLILLLGVSSFATQVPFKIHYQGVLHKDGVPVNSAAQSIQFKLYSSAAGSGQLWDSGNMSIPVSNGVFSVQLGTTDNPISTQTVNGGSLWVEMIVEGSALSPRDEIVSAAFAIRAGSVDGLTIDLGGNLGIGVDPGARLDIGAGALQISSMTAVPSAAPSTGALLYTLRNSDYCGVGTNSTQLWAMFPDSTKVLISSSTVCAP